MPKFDISTSTINQYDASDSTCQRENAWKYIIFTSAFAAFHIRLQFPALIAGTLDTGFLLLALLATLQVLGAEALDLAGLVVSSQFHTQRTRAHEALPGDDGAVVAAASVVQCTQV